MSNIRFLQILSSLAKSIAFSDHLGDVHEALDQALKLSGLPPMPTHVDGTMSSGDWLEDIPAMWKLVQQESEALAKLEPETQGLREQDLVGLPLGHLVAALNAAKRGETPSREVLEALQAWSSRSLISEGIQK